MDSAEGQQWGESGILLSWPNTSTAVAGSPSSGLTSFVLDQGNGRRSSSCTGQECRVLACAATESASRSARVNSAGVQTQAAALLREVKPRHPKQLASYLRLVPSEHSSGTRRRQGSITKAGSTHGRGLLVEPAWHYRRAPSVSLTLKRRHKGQQPAAIEAVWRAQLRLHRRWSHLDTARAKKRTTVAVAVARELACFVWEIAQQPD